MLVSDFDYDLPEELIAQKPLPYREDSRMMLVERKTGEIIHTWFRKFPDYVPRGSLVIINDSKVIPAKVLGKKGDHVIEFLFLQESKEGFWEVLCRPAKKLRQGDNIIFSPNLRGKVIGIGPEGRRRIRISGSDVLSELEKIGYAPLPPYIKRLREQKELKSFDIKRYQTIYARKPGSIAAPTAGLHFTTGILDRLRSKDIALETLSLDVGLATFQPVRVNEVQDHEMLEESYTIHKRTAQSISDAKNSGHPIFAVGTTSVRALESAYANGRIQAGHGTTRLFIYPGFCFQVVDHLLTNFHLPKSTLLMLVSAFSGMSLIKKAYKEAVRLKYRFFSYGDCMLII